MKKITLLLFLTTISVFSQQSELEKVDQIIQSYRNPSSIEALAKSIDYDFSSDIEKVRAVYSWIANNINYDVKSRYQLSPVKFYIVTDEEDYKRRLQREDKQMLAETFQSRKAVCKGYSLLFEKMCSLLKIENQIVLGYVRSSFLEIGEIPTTKNHSWNAVKIENEWHFFDPTFASGYLFNGVWQAKLNLNYFDIKKDVITRTHYPQSFFWLDYLNQKPFEEFCESPIHSASFFNTNSVEVLSPLNGQIMTVKKKRISLKIKGISYKTKVYYQFGSSGKIKSAHVVYDKTIADIKIKNPKENTSLRIYFDGKVALEYQVFVH